MFEKWLDLLRDTWRALLGGKHMGPEVSTWVPDSPHQLITAWHQARNTQSLGFILNQSRISKGLTLLQVQTATGINATYLVKLEHNLVAQPSLFVLVQLAETLDIHLAQLVARLDPTCYPPGDLASLERRWRLCLLAQPGNRNGILMLEAISLVRARLQAPA